MSVSGSNQGVRFGVATSTNRPATPFDGQVIYETDTDRIAAYDSSAWAYKSGDSGLVLISSTAIGSAVSSVTVTNAFSATYENYKIIITGGVGSTTLALRMTLAPNAVSYDGGAFGTVFSTSAFAGVGDNAASQFRYVGGAGSTWQESHIVVLSPFLNKRTFIHATGYWTGSASYAYTGVTTTAGSETDFTISTSAGTITGGTIRVYGYKD